MFKENDPRAFAILKHKHTDWNDLTLFELAYNAKNKDFIAHPCCQKILKKRLFGEMQIRDVDNGLPSWLKIIVSAFLIVPMYRWILFPVKKQLAKKKLFPRLHHKRSHESVEDFRRKSSIHRNSSDSDGCDDDNDVKDQYEAEATKKELNRKLINEIKKSKSHSKLMPYKKSIDQQMVSSKLDMKKEEKDKKKKVGEIFQKLGPTMIP